MMSRVRAVISFLLCSLIALAVWPAGASAKGGPGPTAGIIPLYRIEPLHARVLIPLNPATLADDPSLGGVTLGLTPLGNLYDFSGADPQIVVSPNGSTMAVVTGCSSCQSESTKYTTIRIVTSSGRQLAAWHPPRPMGIEYVSNDGKQVAGHAFNIKTNSFTAWLTLNGKTGKIMRRVGSVDGTFDPALNRFYLANSDGGSYSLTAYDAGTGSVVARLPLPGVDVTQTQQVLANGETLVNGSQPTFTVSPDGQRIAVVDGSTESLTLIDAPHLRVLSTQSIHQPQSWLQKLGQFLGVLPAAAEAKGIFTGTMLSAQFSRDGRSLYVTGETGAPDSTGRTTAWTYLPLRRIDVATGEVQAQADVNGWPWIVGQSFDGGALFALISSNAGSEVLQEYDATTLQPLASRTFSDDTSLVLLRPPSA
jgi:hypothetical protein